MPTLFLGALFCLFNVSSGFDTSVGLFSISLPAPDPVSLELNVLKVSSLFPFLWFDSAGRVFSQHCQIFHG